jgi:aryl-alcohol dehydrogenase-like predicted oxidoreductase
MKMLEESLKRLCTDYLDLWQIHEVVYENDPALHFAPGGAIEALDKAREQGKVRYVGFTGHKAPWIHQKMLAYDYPFDAVQMPLNPFDATFRSFEQDVLPVLNRRGIAPLAMKTLCGTGEAQKQGILTLAETLRYVMSLPIAVLISGIGSRKILEENLSVAREYSPMSEAEMQALRDRCAPYAADGRFELYKTSIKYDADIGRGQHGFPLEKELVA